jgi:hypothetical protein
LKNHFILSLIIFEIKKNRILIVLKAKINELIGICAGCSLGQVTSVLGKSDGRAAKLVSGLLLAVFADLEEVSWDGCWKARGSRAAVGIDLGELGQGLSVTCNIVYN